MKYNFVMEKFDNINRLLSVIESRKQNEFFSDERSSETGDRDFTGTRSYSEARELLISGYNDPVEKIKAGIKINSKGTSESKNSVKNDVVGYAPCVPNAILGLPNSMINNKIAVKKSKVLNIIYDATATADTPKETFIKAGIAVLTLINSLEKNGYRVSLEVAFFAAEKEQKAYASVRLKDWKQPIDIKKITFPFCHPSMLRRIGFKWLETSPKIEDGEFRWGYGRPMSNMHSYDEMVEILRKNKVVTDVDKFISLKLCNECEYDVKEIAERCGIEE